MSSIVEAVLQELGKHDIEKVEAVDMIVGELTFLGEDQLQFAYEIITRDTILEGSKLIITSEKMWRPSRGKKSSQPSMIPSCCRVLSAMSSACTKLCGFVAQDWSR
jgi:Zn finger protein HypA/HybF involved in hydrogenase expression